MEIIKETRHKIEFKNSEIIDLIVELNNINKGDSLQKFEELLKELSGVQ